METKKKKRVGILGGTFDPPTIGHIQMAAEAINLRYLDEVWVVPCGSRKDKDVGTSGEHRYNMTKLLIEDFFPKDYPVKVNDIEIKNGESIPTYPLMKKFMEDPANEKYNFFFIVGSDILDTLKTWDYGETMLAEIKFIIFIRIGYKLKEESLPKNYIIVHSTFVASSSTEIRHRIRALRNWGTLDISHPGLQKRISSDQGQSFAKMYEINIREDHLRTIETGDEDDEVSAERKQLEDNFLGIFGIVPYSIIKYIKDNDLYLDKKTP